MDAVIKVGGSLLREPNKLRNFCKSLPELKRLINFLVVPGGGLVADIIRLLQKE